MNRESRLHGVSDLGIPRDEPSRSQLPPIGSCVMARSCCDAGVSCQVPDFRTCFCSVEVEEPSFESFKVAECSERANIASVAASVVAKLAVSAVEAENA